jgi:hypothetical protein
MKFSFTYDIGFMGSSGLKYGLRGDTNDLPEPHNKTLESLVNYNPRETAKTNPAAKDLTEYEINLEGDPKKKTVRFKEDNIPARLKPLILYLRSKASLTAKK